MGIKRSGLAVDEHGRLISRHGDLVKDFDGDQVAANIKSRLLVFQFEWPYAPNQGISWFELLGKDVDYELLRSVLVRTILGTNGVKTLDFLEFDIDNKTRTLNITGRVNGEIKFEIGGD